MNALDSVANVGAGVSRFQAVAQTPRLREQSPAANKGNVIGALAQLLQSALAKPDARHDLDVVA
jgi:hypothetical protein